jgi:hypothetical protein
MDRLVGLIKACSGQLAIFHSLHWQKLLRHRQRLELRISVQQNRLLLRCAGCNPSICQLQTVHSFEFSHFSQQAIAAVQPFNRQRQALLISKLAGLFAFVFPYTVEHFHQAHEAAAAFGFTLNNELQLFSHALRTGLIVSQGEQGGCI